jgi:hypothetical protein
VSTGNFYPAYAESIFETPTISGHIQQSPYYTPAFGFGSGDITILNNSYQCSTQFLVNQGHYNWYGLSQYSGVQNTQQSWITSNGGYPQILWKSSDYNHNYV